MQPKTCKRIQELFYLQPISTMMEKIIKREMKYQCDGTEHKLMMKIDKITLMKYKINRKHRIKDKKTIQSRSETRCD